MIYVKVPPLTAVLAWLAYKKTSLLYSLSFPEQDSNPPLYEIHSILITGVTSQFMSVPYNGEIMGYS